MEFKISEKYLNYFGHIFEFDSEVKSGRIQQVNVIYIIDHSKETFSKT